MDWEGERDADGRSVDSADGAGASYGDETQQAEPMGRGVPGARSLRILVVDDDDSLVQVLALVYGGTHRLVRAASLAEARRRLLEAQASAEPLDAAIFDVHLPDGLGVDLLRALRQDPGFAPSRGLPVIMLTASGDGQIYEESWDLGSLAYVRKPFEVEELSMAVDRLLAERGDAAPRE